LRSWRLWVWGLGFLGTVAVALLAPSTPGPSHVTAFAAFLLWMMAGLCSEVIALADSVRRRNRLRRGPPAAPADGVIECVVLEGARGERNPDRPRYRRFVAWDEGNSSARGGPLDVFSGPLLGRVAVVPLFVGWGGRRWRDDEVARALKSLEKAASWIESQAVDWGAGVAVCLAETYFEESDDQIGVVDIAVVAEAHQMGLFQAHATERVLAAASRALGRLGFAGLPDWVQQTRGRVGADQVVWLVNLGAAGRSHAIPEDLTPLPGVRLAVCYAQPADFPGPPSGPLGGDSVTCAHELLHLFGASDKYGARLDDFPPGMVTGRDIMLLHESSLARLRVDPLTAVELGWSRDGQRPERKET
jgi:hypothetical protein